VTYELTGMDHIHGPHGAAGIVENPLLLEVHVRLRGRRLQAGDDVRDDGAGVVAMLGDGGFGEVVQLGRLEDVEALEARFQEDVDAVQQG
jgi:hypothetical protein